MSNIAVKIENVSKYYKLYNEPKDRLKEALHPFNKKYHTPFYALKNLNIEIRKGDILGVVGRNGCGKSTLLKLITGVLQPNEGKVSVNGKITALLELGAGFNPEFTGIDNIKFYSKILGITDKDLQDKLPLITAFAELGEFLYQPVKTYSSGMKARLGFSVAVHVDPEILILDEVLAVGDVLFRRKCYAKMEDFFNSGKTIIYVSHDANSVNQLCNRAVLIHDGNIIMDSKPEKVTAYYEKLLFAKPKNIQAVLSEIVSINDNKNKPKRINDTVQHDSIKAEMLVPYYLKDFRPENVIQYRNEDIDIVDPHFTTINGKVVNVLVRGCDYYYKVNYVSKSNSTFERVAFGFDIKTESGVEISSIQSALSNKKKIYLRKFHTKETVKVCFKFHCLLNSGIYYTNLGVSAFNASEQTVLNRKIDASCFKVIQESDQIIGGFVKLISEVRIISDAEELNMEV
jgi:lipopolysaccharide transport system ATP-binding protein